MPPRHVYWTIIVDGKPTAFRAHSREELLPTLKQLQSKHPGAVMKWFARGKLWESQEEERASAHLRGGREQRGRDWRPGGHHQDPRARFKVPRDVKRARFAAKQRREHFDQRSGGWKRDEQGESGPKRPWDQRNARPRPEWPRREGRDRGPGDRPRQDRPRHDGPREDRPREERPRQDRPRENRPPWNGDGRPGERQREWNPERGAPGREGDRGEWQRDRRPAGGPRGEFRDRKPGGPGFVRPQGGRPTNRPPRDDRGRGERGHGGSGQRGRGPGNRGPGGPAPGGRPRGPGGWRKPGGGGKKGGGGPR